MSFCLSLNLFLSLYIGLMNNKVIMKTLLLTILSLLLSLCASAQQRPPMLYGDTSRVGVPYSKDPHVVNFKGRYLMYHSIPPMKGDPDSGWIAESKDLVNWKQA